MRHRVVGLSETCEVAVLEVADLHGTVCRILARWLPAQTPQAVTERLFWVAPRLSFVRREACEEYLLSLAWDELV